MSAALPTQKIHAFLLLENAALSSKLSANTYFLKIKSVQTQCNVDNCQEEFLDTHKVLVKGTTCL